MKTIQLAFIMSAQGINPFEFRKWVQEKTDCINKTDLKWQEQCLENAVKHDPWEFQQRENSWDEEVFVENAQQILEELWLPGGIRKLTADHYGMSMTPLFHQIFNYCIDGRM